MQMRTDSPKGLSAPLSLEVTSSVGFRVLRGIGQNLPTLIQWGQRERLHNWRESRLPGPTLRGASLREVCRKARSPLSVRRDPGCGSLAFRPLLCGWPRHHSFLQLILSHDSAPSSAGSLAPSRSPLSKVKAPGATGGQTPLNWVGLSAPTSTLGSTVLGTWGNCSQSVFSRRTCLVRVAWPTFPGRAHVGIHLIHSHFLL